MGIFDIFSPQGYSNYGQAAVAPVPTPNIPKNSNYVFTPQTKAGTVQQYAGPAYGPQYNPPKPVVTSPTAPKSPSGATGSRKPTPPATNPQPQPQQYSGDNWGDIFRTYYPGWNEQAAREDFYRTRGGNVGSFGGGSSGGSNGDVSTVSEEAKRREDEAKRREDEAKRREDETRNAIESGYSQYAQNLQGLQSQYENIRQESLGSAAKTYEQLFGGLTEQKQTNLDKLAAGKQEVQARQASSIKDLQNNLSNVLRGATMQFGAMGAGDTSATRTMLPYAYTKLAGTQEGNIRNQSNQQQFDIEQETRDTEANFTQMWRQTEVDKEAQLQGIRDYYGTAIQNVQTAMAQAPLDKAQALSTLNQSLLSEAMANLRNLEAEDRQAKENVKTWATNRMSELNNMKLQLAGSASFKPQDIVRQELSVQGAGPASNGQGMDFMDYVTATRKKYLGQ